MEKIAAVIPPDALYATSTKKIQNPNYHMHHQHQMVHQQQQSSPYIYEPMFNDSKVRIHTFSRKHLGNQHQNNSFHQQQNNYLTLQNPY